MGRVAMIFSLFGVTMPKGEKMSIRLSSGFARGRAQKLWFSLLYLACALV